MAAEQQAGAGDDVNPDQAREAAVARAAVRAHVDSLEQHRLAVDATHDAAGGADGTRYLLPDLLDAVEPDRRSRLADAVLQVAPRVCEDHLRDARRRLPSTAGLSNKAALDELGEALDHVASAIRQDRHGHGDAADAVDRLRMQGPPHAAARFAQGFASGEVSFEYAMLRRNLVHRTREAYDRELGVDEVELLNAAVDELSMAATISFDALRVGRARLEAEAMSRFLSSLAHDLRSNLGGATMSMELIALELREQAAQGDVQPAKAAELAEEATASRGLIQSTIETMTRVLEAERMRAGAGAVRVRSRQVELQTLLRGLSRAAARAAAAQGADDPHIEVDCPDHLALRTDPDLLTSIVMNFLNNAVHYGGDRTIRLVGREATPADGERARQAGGPPRVVVEVRDQGPGIAAEHLDALFDRYHRGAGTRRRGGLGLGLFIARCAADLIDGQLAVDSAVGRGSTFSVCLPADLAPPDGSRRARTVPDQPRRP